MDRKRIIDPKFEIQNIVNSIKKYFVANGNENTKAVIGISGGKDSTVAAALLVRALGADRVVGVMMPQGHQSDLDDSRRVCEILGIQNFVINIEPACSELFKSFMGNTKLPLNDQINTNAPARIRMNILYMVAAALGGRVINTGNASELYVGYTTKYGDLAGDYAIFRDYYVREVIEIGKELRELPIELVVKAPADGMSGKTDEDNLGFTYEVLDRYLIDGVMPEYDVYRAIQTRFRNNQHKRCIELPHPRVKTRHFEDQEIDYEERWF